MISIVFLTGFKIHPSFHQKKKQIIINNLNGDQSQGLIPQCAQTRNLGDFWSMHLVPEIKPAQFVGLLAGTKKCAPCDQNFDAKYEYTLGDLSPRQVPTTSPLVCADLQKKNNQNISRQSEKSTFDFLIGVTCLYRLINAVHVLLITARRKRVIATHQTISGLLISLKL